MLKLILGIVVIDIVFLSWLFLRVRRINGWKN